MIDTARPSTRETDLMALPQHRILTDTGGWRWVVTVDAGRLVLTREGGVQIIEFTDPTELRSLAPQLTRAVAEHDQAAQHDAARASAARRQRRKLAGEPVGERHRPFIEPPEPALNLDPLIAQGAPA